MRHCRAQGFTLFELLATLIIISVIVTIGVLSIPDTTQQRQRETLNTVSALITLAQESALFNGENIGLLFKQQGYAFYRMQEGKWQMIDGDPQFKEHEFPEDMEIDLYLEGLKVDFSSKPSKKPHIFILASGETTPFELRIGDATDIEISLTSDANGKLTMADETPYGAQP